MEFTRGKARIAQSRLPDVTPAERNPETGTMAQESETTVVKPACLAGTYLSVKTQQLIYGLVIVLAVMTIGMVLTLQGWKSVAPAFDMLTYFNSAETLLKTGAPARYGDVSSYGAFSPPGTTWLMAPGMLISPSSSTVCLDWASPSLALFGPLGTPSFTFGWPISPSNG